MSDNKLRWLGLGLVATAGAGVLALTAMMNPAFAHADTDDIGLVIGGSGTPIPGPEFVEAANSLYLDNGPGGVPNNPDLTFFQATPDNPFGNGLFTPEGLYPLTGVHTLELNFPAGSDGFPSETTSVGQGISIVESAIAANMAAGDTSTVFGYSQSATIASLVMQQLDPSGTPENDPGLNFLLIGDPSNPNGGLLERFNGFETTSGHTVTDPLSIPSLGVAFDGATPADDFSTNIYSLEYDGFADFPRYPINLLSDLNAFLGIDTIHGTYLNGGVDGSGPTAEQIASAILLPGSMDSGTADSLTNYYIIDETAPLVSLLPTKLQELLGPDLTFLINLGYGDGTLGYSVTADSPANVPTPFGLFPDVSPSTILSTLVTDTEQGVQNLMSGTDPFSTAVDPATSSATSMTDLLSATSWPDLMSALSADAADPSATLTDLVNAISTSASALYSVALPTADIINALVTSVPSYDASLITDNLASGNLQDALGLPIAADAGLVTLAAGFEFSAIEDAASQISDAFSGLF
jgi:hypothetical protein